MDYCKLRAPLSLGCAALMLTCLGGIAPAQAADATGARQITVRYRDLNLEIRRGEILALIGASGSGKSVLLKMILGLNPKQFCGAGQFSAFFGQSDNLPPAILG